MPQTITELDEMFSHAFYKPLRLTNQIKYGILDIMKPKYPGYAEGNHVFILYPGSDVMFYSVCWYDEVKVY